MAVKKVLVVDDSPSHLEKIKSIVAGVGCEVFTATSGKDAIQQATENLPELIFMDIYMDDIDGFGACREIHTSPETGHIPVVFVSGRNKRADRLWAKKQGAKGIISKPYSDEEIIAEIQKY